VVGADNFAYAWLPKFPDFCDVPAQDITLAGRNYEYRNVLGNVAQTVRCGAYVPFGTETRPGQVIQGSTRCTGAILRCNPDGSDLEVVAWGLRNPYGIAFGPDGALSVVDWGEIEIAPEAGGVRMVAGTGAVWRIRHTTGPRGERPPEPMRVPLYPLQYLLVGAVVVGQAGAAWLLGRWRAARQQSPLAQLRRAARRR
jgi:hypothetical protein